MSRIQSTKPGVVLVACFACVLATVGAARGDRMFGVDSSLDALYVIDVETGLITQNIGPLHPDPDRFMTPVAMAIRPSDGAIFVSNNSPPTDDGLATVDPATGLATLIGGSEIDGALAFDSSGVLYAANGAGQLATVDTTTGVLTSLGGPVLPRLFGLDYNVADGFLYGITRSDPFAVSDLLKVDPATGGLMATIPLSTFTGGSAPGTLVFDTSGKLIGSTNEPNLFDIDPATGAVSNIRAADTGPQGLGIPEPGTGMLIVTAVLGLNLLRRRHEGR